MDKCNTFISFCQDNKYDVNYVIDVVKTGIRNGFNVIFNFIESEAGFFKKPVWQYDGTTIDSSSIITEDIIDNVDRNKKYGYSVLVGTQSSGYHLICLDVDVDDGITPFKHQTDIVNTIRKVFEAYNITYTVEQTLSGRYHFFILLENADVFIADSITDNENTKSRKRAMRENITNPEWKKLKDGNVVDGEVELIYRKKAVAVYSGFINQEKPFFITNQLKPVKEDVFISALTDLRILFYQHTTYYQLAEAYHIIYQNRTKLSLNGWEIEKNLVGYLINERQEKDDDVIKLVFEAVYGDDYDENMTEAVIENAREKSSDELQTVASVINTLKQALEADFLSNSEKETIKKALDRITNEVERKKKINERIQAEQENEKKYYEFLSLFAMKALNTAYQNAEVYFDMQQEKYLIYFLNDSESAIKYFYHEQKTFTQLIDTVINSRDFRYEMKRYLLDNAIEPIVKDGVKDVDKEIAKQIKLEIQNSIKKIRQTVYLPLRERIIQEDNNLLFNIYVPSQYDSIPRTDELSFDEALQILEKDCPAPLAVVKNLTHADKKKMRYLIEHTAWKAKYPQKVQTAVLIYGNQGTGKSLYANEILKYAVGGENFQEVGEMELQSQFNDWMAGRRIIVFDEVKTDHQRNFTILSLLKRYITQDYITINIKHRKLQTFRNYADFYLFSNFDDPLKIELSDRRFFIMKAMIPLMDAKTGEVLSPYLKELNYKNMIDFMKDFERQRDAFIRTLLKMKTDINFLRYDLFTNEKYDMIVRTMSQLELFVYMLKNDVITLLERVDARHLYNKLEHENNEKPSLFYEKLLKAVFELLSGFIETSLLPILYQFVMNDKQKSDKTIKDTVSSSFDKDKIKIDGDSLRVVIFEKGIDREYIRKMITTANQLLVNKNYRELADEVIKKLQILKLKEMTKEMKNDDDGHDPKGGPGGISTIDTEIDDEPPNINQAELQDVNVDDLIKKATQNIDNMIIETSSTPSSVKPKQESRNSNPEVEPMKTEHEAVSLKQESKQDEPEIDTVIQEPETEADITNQEPLKQERKTYRDIAVITKATLAKKNKKKSKNRKLIQTQAHTDEIEQDKTTEEIVIDETQLDLTAIEQYELPEINFTVRDNITLYSDLYVGVFDIEATGLDPNTDKVLAICYKVYQNKQEIDSKIYLLENYSSETKMIKAFINDVIASGIDLLTGYNILEFDLPFLEKKLNNDNILFIKRDYQRRIFQAEKWTDNYIYQSKIFMNNKRVYVVDAYALVLKYDTTEKVLESHDLKYVAEHFNFRNDDRVILQHTDIEKAYSDDREAFINYLENDVKEAYQIFDLLYPTYYYLRFIMPFSLDYEDVYVMSTAKLWEKLLASHYPKSYYEQLQPEPEKKFRGGLAIIHSGLYRNVYKLDISSMYPHIILNYKIYPEEKDINKYMLAYVKLFKNKRLEYKKKAKQGDKNADMLQSALKLLINSAFGFCGTASMKFNDYKAAAGITAYGRLMLKFMIDFLVSRGAIIIECDTDGIYYTTNGDIDGVKLYEELRAELNKIKFDIELEYKDAVMFASDKKNYILYLKDKIVIKGSKWRGRDKSKLRRKWAIEYIHALATDPEKAMRMENEMRELIRSGQAWEWLACNVRVSKTDKYLLNAGYREGDRVRHCYVDAKRKSISTDPSSGYDIKYYMQEFNKLLKEIHGVVYADKNKQEHQLSC